MAFPAEFVKDLPVLRISPMAECVTTHRHFGTHSEQVLRTAEELRGA
jgi:hypothetical protein